MPARSTAPRPRRVVAALAVLVVAALPWRGAAAVEFRATADAATVLYDAPSAKAKPLFVLGRDTPLEVIVVLEGWVKVRDATGTIGWVDQKALTERRAVEVRAPVAEILANPDPSAPVVFRAERDVLLELAEPALTAATTATPGWVKVRHRDGQTGYVRIAQIFGL
jgi:SH3-like domain-containing protein